MHEHATIIDGLGGGTAIADWLTERTGRKVDRERVYKWKRIGVPWRFRPLVAELAKAKNFALPDGFLEYRAA